jgi:tRNA threonylcarbamoyladenosine biosynthesis protein TsaE
MQTVNIKTEKDTQILALQIAKKLKGGEIIALEGDLGAGKTTFIQYLAKALGIKNSITSPTFVLMKIYQIKNKEAKEKNLVHVDCYRLDDPQELFYLGLEEYLNNPSTIVAIEWADKIKNYLKDFSKVIWLKIVPAKEQRKITVKFL